MPVFKECTMCHKSWRNREAFLSDPEIRVVGYQPNFLHLAAGLFLFNHIRTGCGTTVALPAGQFTDLYRGPIFEVPREAVKKCPEFCMEDSSLEPCPERCECAYVREVLQIARHWPKQKQKTQ